MLWDVDPERTDLDFSVNAPSLPSVEANSQRDSSCGSETGAACGFTDLDFLDDPYDVDY